MKHLMKPMILSAALLMAACGPTAEEPAPEAPAEPQTLFEQALAKDQTESTVFGYTLFWGMKDQLEEPCVGVRETVERGVIPDTVAEDSVYHPYIGSQVYAIQCGELRLTGPSRISDRYMLIISPDSDTPEIAPCRKEDGTDGCDEVVSGRTGLDRFATPETEEE